VVKDLRKYTKVTQNQSVIGFLILVFLVGIGLIYLFYGQGAALAGFGCLLAALIPAGLVVLFLWLMDRFVKRKDGDI
jgi:membrane protein implicated in regulation of membrane protease activity